MDQGMETLFRGSGTLTLLLTLDLNGIRRNNKESFLFLPGPTTSRWLVSHRGASEMEKAAYHKPRAQGGADTITEAQTHTRASAPIRD